MSEQERHSSENVEGPEPGSPAMQKIIREAEEQADKNAPDQAEREQERQKDEGTENSG